jgi:uncharacterized protein involved in type VI secretion and phage assembly
VGTGGNRNTSGDHDLAGLYYAIVTQNDDPEGPRGRIKVRYPWMPEGDKDQSFWAHLIVPMAGKEFGTYVVPEIEDTVVVMFLSGDIRQAVIIGGMWNEVDEPVETNDGEKNDFRVLKSRSAHRLIFDDTNKTKVVMVDRLDTNLVALGPHAKAGQSEKKNNLEIPAPPTINGSTKEGVSIQSMTGTLNIWCPQGTLKVEGKHVEISTDLKAGQKLEMEGKQSATLTSVGNSKYQSAKIKIGP